MPDVQMNKGPLPSTAGGPAGSDGTPDGRYNFNSELLSGIDAYSYAESARMGSDKNYQQIPHRLQKIIPLLNVPDGKKGLRKLPISHAVDQGDIAFALALEPKRMPGVFYEKGSKGTFQTQNLSMLTPFCNFVTVNYLLAGLQIYHLDTGISKDQNDAWHQLWEALDPLWNKYKSNSAYLDDKNYQNLKMLVRKFIPFGICAGSEHQGGKHELSYMPVQAAVNHVTTMTIDGQSRDLVNYWRDHNLDAGDQLGFHLEKVQIKNTYTLNHYYKSYATANIDGSHTCWQLVPSKLYPCTSALYNSNCLSPWEHGWWRVGQMMHFRGKHGSTNVGDICSNDMIYLKGGLLQVTFAPVWHDYSRGITSGAPSVHHSTYPGAYPPPPTGTGGSSAGGGSSSTRPGTGGAGSGPPPPPLPPAGSGGPGAGPPPPPGVATALVVLTQAQTAVVGAARSATQAQRAATAAASVASSSTESGTQAGEAQKQANEALKQSNIAKAAETAAYQAAALVSASGGVAAHTALNAAVTQAKTAAAAAATAERAAKAAAAAATAAAAAGGGPSPPPAWQSAGITTKIHYDSVDYPLQTDDALVSGGFIFTCNKINDDKAHLWKISFDKVVHTIYDREVPALSVTRTLNQTVDRTAVLAAEFGNGIEFLDVNVFKQTLQSGTEKYLLLQAGESELELPAFDSAGILQLPKFKVEKDDVNGGYKITRRDDSKVMNSDITQFPYDLDGFNLHWNGILFIPGKDINQTLDLGDHAKARQAIEDETSIPEPSYSTVDPNQAVRSILGLFWQDTCFFEWNSRQYVNETGAITKAPTSATATKVVHSTWHLTKDKMVYNNQAYSSTGQRFPFSRNGTLKFSNGCHFKQNTTSPYPNNFAFVDESDIPKSLNQIYSYDGCRIGVNYLTEWIVEYWDGVKRTYADNTNVTDEASQKFLIEFSGHEVFASSKLPYVMNLENGTTRMVFQDGSFIQGIDPPPPSGESMYTYWKRTDERYTGSFPKIIGDFSIYSTIISHRDKSYVIKRKNPDGFATADGTQINESTFREYTINAPAPVTTIQTTDADTEVKEKYKADSWWMLLPERGEGDNRWTVELYPSDKRIISASKTYTVVREGQSKEYKVTLAYFRQSAESDNESECVQITDVTNGSDAAGDFIYVVDYSTTPAKSKLMHRSDFVISQLEPLFAQTSIARPELDFMQHTFTSDEERTNKKLSRLYFRLEVKDGESNRQKRGYFTLKIQVAQQYSPWKATKSKPKLSIVKLTGFYAGTTEPEIRDFSEGKRKGFGGHPWEFAKDNQLKAQPSVPLSPTPVLWFSNHFESWTSIADFEAAYNSLDNYENSKGVKGVGQAFGSDSDMEIDDTDPAPGPPANLLDKARSIFGGKQDPKAAAKRAAAEALTAKKAPAKRKISVVRDD